MYGTVHSRMPHPSTIRPALVRIIQRLAAAGVGAITVLGSTGAGAYLDRAERTRVVRLAVDAAGEVPVHAGVSALRTAHALAEDAAAPGCLPRPLLGLGAEDRAEVADVVDRPVVRHDGVLVGAAADTVPTWRRQQDTTATH